VMDRTDGAIRHSSGFPPCHRQNRLHGDRRPRRAPSPMAQPAGTPPRSAPPDSKKKTTSETNPSWIPQRIIAENTK
jgi:hypothetical protein